MQGERLGLLGLLPASALGIASPLCMYGTIPIAASFAARGMREDWLAAFMMSSVLLNPQLLLYSAVLGMPILLVRLLSCLLCGMAAGYLVYRFYTSKGRRFFRFDGFGEPANRDTDPDRLRRFLKNLGRNVRATGGYFLLGIVLAALFQCYVPAEAFAVLFGRENEGFGLLLAAAVGVPLYVCGGGTVPLLQAWLLNGMSPGSAAAFMITGPATKIINLSALKSCLGSGHFFRYLLFVLLFSLAAGWLTDWWMLRR